MKKVLVVDEDPLVREFILNNLKAKGLEVSTAENGTQALALAKSEALDLVIADNQLPDLDHKTFLRRIKEILSKDTHIVITSSEEGVCKGELLVKPLSNEILEEMLVRAKKQTAPKLKEIIAVSALMQNILEEAIRIAKSNASVLISGESGTGKEVIAEVIHAHSQRASHPFVKVNCAAVPENLVESEFFGHEKGSFTGASAQKQGRFERAHNGTLLLDEVTEIPLHLQAKLLRAIQEQEFERVGGTRAIKVNVRILSTSNRNTQNAVEEKVLREDLYYRLNVVPIHLPPLREHPEDILPLAEFFLKKACEENQLAQKALSKEARQKLLAYHWPGNVRELANMMERAAVTCSAETLKPEHFGFEAKQASPLTLEEMEKKHILDTLQTHGHDQKRAATALGITLRKLQNKLKEY